MKRVTKKLLTLAMVLVFLLQTTSVGAAQTPPVPQTSTAATTPATTAASATTPTPTSASTPTLSASPYSDVRVNDGNFIFINYLNKHGLLQGFPNGTFRPAAGLTRAEAAAAVVKAAGLKISPPKAVFKDVGTKYWAAASIAAAKDAKLLSGYPDGTFRPEAKLTRAEGIALILKLSKQADPGVDLPVLADVAPKHWAARPIAIGLASEMVGLSSDKKHFLPTALLTRGSLARALAILLTQDPALYETSLTDKLNVVTGSVTVTRAGSKTPETITGSTRLEPGDTVNTGAAGQADLTFPDGTGLRLDKDCQFTLKEARGRSYIKSDGTPGTAVEWLAVDLKRGEMFGALASSAEANNDNSSDTGNTGGQSAAIRARAMGLRNLSENRVRTAAAATTPLPWWKQSGVKRTRVKIDMPTGVAAIRGTFWMNQVTASGQSSTALITGHAVVTSGGQTVSVTAGQSTTITSAGAPPAPPAALNVTERQSFAAVRNWVIERAQEIQNNLPAPPQPISPAERPEQPTQTPTTTQPNATKPNDIVSAVNNALDNAAKGTTTPDSGGGSSVVPVTRVELDIHSASLVAGGSPITVTAHVYPDTATNKGVKWASSNESVATVAYGVITPVSAGSATITATTVDGNFTDTCAVTVIALAVPVTGVQLDIHNASLLPGDSPITVTAHVYPDNATNKGVNWTSSDPLTASVVNGVITPVSGGTTTITATTVDGSFSDSWTVTVQGPTVVSYPADGAANVSAYTRIMVAYGVNVEVYDSSKIILCEGWDTASPRYSYGGTADGTLLDVNNNEFTYYGNSYQVTIEDGALINADTREPVPGYTFSFTTTSRDYATVSGTVYNPDGSVNYDGGYIDLYYSSGGTYYDDLTFSGGTFSIYDIQTGDYILKVRSNSSVYSNSNAIPIHVVDGTTIDETVNLGKTMVEGRVYDPNGNPLTSLSNTYAYISPVNLNCEEQIPVNPNGTFRFGGVPTGRYRIRVESSMTYNGYTDSLPVDVDLVQGSTVAQNVYLTNPTVTVFGKVYDYKDNATTSIDTLRISPINTDYPTKTIVVSPGNDIYIGGLPTGNYKFTAPIWSPTYGYQDTSTIVPVTAGTPQEIHIHGISVNGTVYAPTGAPYDWQYNSIGTGSMSLLLDDGNGNSGFGLVDYSGKFSFNVPTSGIYKLSTVVHDAVYTDPLPMTITVSPDMSPVSIWLTTPEILGKIRNPDGSPMLVADDMLVLVYSSSGFSRSGMVNSDGTFKVGGLPTGEYTIQTLGGNGRFAGTLPIPVSVTDAMVQGTFLEKNLTLTRTMISGTVTIPDPRIIPKSTSISVELYDSNDNCIAIDEVGEDGMYQFGVPSGNYKLKVVVSGDSPFIGGTFVDVQVDKTAMIQNLSLSTV